MVRCDEAAWRFLGLSLAGYNALISLALAAIAAWAAAMEWRASVESGGNETGAFTSFRTLTGAMGISKLQA